MKFLFSILLLWVGYTSSAQNILKRGVLRDAQTLQAIEGALVIILPENKTTFSDERGVFTIKASTEKFSLEIKAIGYKTITLSNETFSDSVFINLEPKKNQLEEITISTKAGQETRTISKLDIKMRGLSNSQEILRMVPGLFIGQHQGGGKAEQIFIRGFDCDHGTDINITADGMPVNMVSQAHGQGYADMHFIIPETVDQVDFMKGCYTASKGNFTTSGFVDLKTKNVLNQNQVKLEGGMFDTYRAMGMFNLLGPKAREKQHSLYLATEYAYSNGYFDSPQNFNRKNIVLKYAGKLNKNNFLTASISSFNSTWLASGQIPDRAVASGLIGFYGAIDNTEGGSTGRKNINLQLISNTGTNSYLKNQIYYSKYAFDLHTNFTFYLVDSINGDQIRQKENRDLIGYTSSYTHTMHIGSSQFTSEIGAAFRYDFIKDLELAHTLNRYQTLNQLAFGNVNELNLSSYINEQIKLNEKISLNLGLRFDKLNNTYTDHLANNKILKAGEGIVCPKLSFYYYPNLNTQLYLQVGKGFHSNDTRVCVTQNGLQVLPAAYSSDLGLISKPTKNLLVQAALWALKLEQEFVYSGDGGFAEPSGATQRVGLDILARYQVLKVLYIDADLNYAHGRYSHQIEGENYIPLAPIFSSTGGITLKNLKGLSGSLRYRWLSDRPANESYTLVAKGYFINDMVINYLYKKIELGLSITNIFNVQWKETQFDTESRLKNETQAVEEMHFTPGTKLAAKLSVSLYF